MKEEGDVRLSIQPKADCVEDIWDVVKRCGAEGIVGFNDGNLKYMKRARALAPHATFFWDRWWGHPLNKEEPTSTTLLDEIKIALDEQFDYLVLNKNGCTEEAVKEIHEAKLKAGVWTLSEDDPIEMARFVKMGLDRFYVDHPRSMLAVLATAEK